MNRRTREPGNEEAAELAELAGLAALERKATVGFRRRRAAGARKRLWFGRFLSGGGSWNYCAPNAGNDRQTCGKFLRCVFSGLRRKWAGRGLRGRRGLRGSTQRSRLHGDHKGPDVVQINMVRHSVVYKVLVLIGIASLLNALRGSRFTVAALQFLYQTEHEVIVILPLHWRKADLRVSRRQGLHVSHLFYRQHRMRCSHLI